MPSGLRPRIAVLFLRSFAIAARQTYVRVMFCHSRGDTQICLPDEAASADPKTTTFVKCQLAQAEC